MRLDKDDARTVTAEPSGTVTSFNAEAAEKLRECAAILRAQEANPFRVNAYRRAAGTLESLGTDAREILEEKGMQGLIALPGIGKGLASAIDEMARTGRLSQLDRLRGEATPELQFQSVPGIGPALARAIHDTLHVESLEELELAAHDGRLRTVPGIGRRRAEAIKAGLAARLRRGAPRRLTTRARPAIELLLDVDREYRNRAQEGELPRIAPRRFNPEGKAWLPVLHTDRDGWHFTALFSNTALAHELARVRVRGF